MNQIYKRKKKKEKRKNHNRRISAWLNIFSPFVFCFLIFLTGCVSENIDDQSYLTSYQQSLTNRSPRRQTETTDANFAGPLEILKPVPSPENPLPEIEFSTDPNTGKKIAGLTIEQAIARSLANSPEIIVVSFDPSIARQDITRAASDFDFTAFSSLNYENEDNPANSIYQPGQSESRAFESGIRQKTITGSEWSLSYALTRSWDDLSGRTLSTRYEPILGFQLRQPLLRDAWQDVTLAGVDIAKLNYKISLLGFRQKAEQIATQVISTYWRLLQARNDLEIYRELLKRTLETKEKVEGRREIDATEVHIRQTEAYVKTREAALLQANRRVSDAQDVLVRLMADSQLNVLEEFNIIPASPPSLNKSELEVTELLEVAVQKNPVIQQARIGIEIADINIRVAENRDMPRLDLLTSARTQSLAGGYENANERLSNGDYVSYGAGLSLEYPLGNRKREAELLQRRIERRKAVTILENIADQAAQLTKEKIRGVETNFSEIQIQKAAVEAARIHLKVLEDSEIIQDKLTPEFLLVKLQAQESLANAQMAETRAIIDFNIALAELSQTLGTVLEMHQVEQSLPIVRDSDSISGQAAN